VYKKRARRFFLGFAPHPPLSAAFPSTA
jgi:hypothetical protein